jgi:hypothetical protein
MTTPHEPTFPPLRPSTGTNALRRGVARRTVAGAAWSAPVLLAAVAAPQAAASTTGEPAAEFYWADEEGVQNESSVLFLRIESGSPAVGSTGTVLLRILDYGTIPDDVGRPPAWTYTRNPGAYTGIIASPVGGVTAGTKAFTVPWSELSGAYDVVATWQNDKEQGLLSAPIRVGFGPAPTLQWIPDRAVFGGTATLRLSVPANSYAVGRRAVVFSTEYFPPEVRTPPFPSGTTVALPAGWAITSDQTATGYETTSLTAGVHDLVHTLGAGTAAVTPGVVLSVGRGDQPRALLDILPA